MVRKKDDLGGHYHEPPYTTEETEDFYRRVGSGPIAWTRLPRADQIDLAQALINPPLPNPPLVNAAQRHAALIRQRQRQR